MSISRNFFFALGFPTFMYIWISWQPKLVSLWNCTQRYLIIIQRNLQNLKLKEWVFQELLIFFFLNRPILCRYIISTCKMCISVPQFCSAILRRITKIFTLTYKFPWLTILNCHLRWPPHWFSVSILVIDTDEKYKQSSFVFCFKEMMHQFFNP